MEFTKVIIGPSGEVSKDFKCERTTTTKIKLSPLFLIFLLWALSFSSLGVFNGILLHSCRIQHQAVAKIRLLEMERRILLRRFWTVTLLLCKCHSLTLLPVRSFDSFEFWKSILKFLSPLVSWSCPKLSWSCPNFSSSLHWIVFAPFQPVIFTCYYLLCGNVIDVVGAISKTSKAFLPIMLCVCGGGHNNGRLGVIDVNVNL